MKIVSTIDSTNLNAVSVVIYNDDRSAEEKTVSTDDFIRALNAGTVSDGKISRIGALPEGFFDGGYEIVSGKFEAIIHVPAGLRPLMYFDKVYTIPFPDLCFYFKSENGKVIASKVFALKERIKKTSQLFHYPFGNVYNGGSICWGGNVPEIPAITCMKDFEKVITLFFGAVTNNDLYQAPKMVVDGKEVRMEQTELLQYLQGQKVFPVKILNAEKSGAKKVSDL